MKAKRTRKTTANKKSFITKARNYCPVPSGTLLVIGGKENKGEEGPENKKKAG